MIDVSWFISGPMVNYVMYPKGVPIPPSGHNTRTSADKYTPPPPPSFGSNNTPRLPWDGPCHCPNPPRYCILLRPPPLDF